MATPAPAPQWKDPWLEARRQQAPIHTGLIPRGAKTRSDCVVQGVLAFPGCLVGFAAVGAIVLLVTEEADVADSIFALLPILFVTLPPSAFFGGLLGLDVYRRAVGYTQTQENAAGGPVPSSGLGYALRSYAGRVLQEGRAPVCFLPLVPGALAATTFSVYLIRWPREITLLLLGCVASWLAAYWITVNAVAVWQGTRRLVRLPPYRFEPTALNVGLGLLGAAAYAGGLYFLFCR
jgi:hypothetical protein